AAADTVGQVAHVQLPAHRETPQRLLRYAVAPCGAAPPHEILPHAWYGTGQAGTRRGKATSRPRPGPQGPTIPSYQDTRAEARTDSSSWSSEHPSFVTASPPESRSEPTRNFAHDFITRLLTHASRLHHNAVASLKPLRRIPEHRL